MFVDTNIKLQVCYFFTRKTVSFTKARYHRDEVLKEETILYRHHNIVILYIIFIIFPQFFFDFTTYSHLYPPKTLEVCPLCSVSGGWQQVDTRVYSRVIHFDP